VQLQSRPAGSTGPFTSTATTTSSSTGTVTYPDVVVSRSSQYRLSMTSDSAYRGARSTPRTVIALRTIGLVSPSHSALVGHFFALRGLVRPAGRGTKILLQRKLGTVWSTRASTLLSTDSQYSFPIRPRARGTLTYRTLVLANARYGRSTSRVVTIRVSVSRRGARSPYSRSL
jgi:hypothetical protein